MDFQRIDRIRKGGHVKRYHTHQCHHPGTIGDHSWFVAWLSGEIWLKAHSRTMPPADLYRYALEHDMSEFDTGDPPGWAKSAWKNLREAFKRVEDCRNKQLNLLTVSPKIRSFVKAADQLDVLFWALEERRMGNVAAIIIFVRTSRQIQQWIYKLDYKDLADVVSAIRTELIYEMQRLDLAQYNSTSSDVEEGLDYYSRLGATVS